MNSGNYITPEKKKALEAELEDLRGPKRKEIIGTLEYAKSLGDLSENAEYQQAREAQSSIEERINKIESILKTALIVSGHTTDTVTIGSKVVIKKEGAKDTSEYKIVSKHYWIKIKQGSRCFFFIIIVSFISIITKHTSRVPSASIKNIT